jgi:hypothetical protein
MFGGRDRPLVRRGSTLHEVEMGLQIPLPRRHRRVLVDLDLERILRDGRAGDDREHERHVQGQDHTPQRFAHIAA